jgi:hypothetical protein
VRWAAAEKSPSSTSISGQPRAAAISRSNRLPRSSRARAPRREACATTGRDERRARSCARKSRGRTDDGRAIAIDGDIAAASMAKTTRRGEPRACWSS